MTLYSPMIEAVILQREREREREKKRESTLAFAIWNVIVTLPVPPAFSQIHAN